MVVENKSLTCQWLNIIKKLIFLQIQWSIFRIVTYKITQYITNGYIMWLFKLTFVTFHGLLNHPVL